ncbi:MAG: flagellar filament capping protein FliD [Deltaproteobacteria bacterium]
MAVNRLTGLSSGFDYESVIKKLMQAEQAPVNKLKQKKQIFRWQQDTYRELNTSLLALKNEAFNLKITSAYKSFTSNSSDTAVVSSTPTSNAVEGTYSIKVRRLATTSEKANTATSAELKSSAEVTQFDVRGKDFYVSFEGEQKHISWTSSEAEYTTIEQLRAGIQSKLDNAFGANQITASIADGTKIKFEAANSVYKSNIILNNGTTSDALTQLNFSNNAQAHINLETQLKDLTFKNGGLTFDAADDKLKFSINGSNFEVSKTATLQSLITTVNADKNADVTMGYDSAKDIFYIRRKSSGAGKDIALTDGTGSNFSTALGFNATVQGQNSLVDFKDNKGVETIGIEKASNNISISGISFNLLKVDETAYKTVTVSKNVDDVFNKIKNFVTKYNETIDKLNAKTSEKRYLDYLPLTDEQKEAMTDTQVEQWEAKAKSGLINGDTIIQGVVRDLRYAMSNAIPGLNTNFDQLKDFGITTGGYLENGKLKIDETKLKQVIAENPDEVVAFFSSNPLNVEGSSLSGVVNVDNKDFKLKINGVTQTITLAGSYDLSTSDGKVNFIKQINDKLSEKFGYTAISASLSSDNKVVFNSPAGNSFTFNSGEANDALGTIGLTNGVSYDASRKGIMSKVYDKLNVAMKNITSKAGSTASSLAYYDTSAIGQEISRLDTRITQANKRLTQVETRYYNQFTAMETALSKMNSQSSWLSQQFGGS